MPSNTRSSGSPGSKWEKHGEGYRLDFVDSKMSHESMSDLREAILELYEGCAALQESVRSASPIVPRELPDEEVSRGTSDSEEEVASKPAENSDVLEQPSSSDSKED